MQLFVVLLALFLMRPAPVLADYQTAYNDYTYNYSLYSAAYHDYQVAKSTYATYKTLTSEADAIIKYRLVLQTRDKAIQSYYDLLAEKLQITPSVPDGNKTAFSNIRLSEKKWFDDHQRRIAAASTLDDLNGASGEFQGKYPQIDSETKQAIGIVLSAKTDTLINSWEKSATDLTAKLKEVETTGENVGLGTRGVDNARLKEDLATQKLTQAKKLFFFDNNFANIDLPAAQQQFVQSTQYLREATNYLLEVVRGITG